MFRFIGGQKEDSTVAATPAIPELNRKHIDPVVHNSSGGDTSAIRNRHSQDSSTHSPELDSLVACTHCRYRTAWDEGIA
jgi:hypothetical protein